MKISTIIFLFIPFLSIELFAQNSDSVKTFTLKEITVVGHKYSIDRSEFPIEQDNLGSVLKLGEFNIVRKGISLAQDIYADGLKEVIIQWLLMESVIKVPAQCGWMLLFHVLILLMFNLYPL